MTIRSAAAKGIIDYIRTHKISSTLLYSRNESNNQLINILYESQSLSDSELDDAISDAISLDAKGAVEHMRKCNSYADHSCTYPEHLAYAIQNGQLSKRELRVVDKHLDNEKDLDEFCEHYGKKGLVGGIRQRLLNSSPLSFF